MKGLLTVLLILMVVSAVPALARPNDQDNSNSTNKATTRHWGNNNQNRQTTTRHWGNNNGNPQTTTRHWGNSQPDNASRPGWAHGQKVGWHGDDDPRGWERRHHHHRHHQWDRDHDHDRDWARRHHHERREHHRDHDRD